MPAIGTLDMVSLNLRVPRGNQGYWQLILKADNRGAWTIETIVRETNVTTRSVSQFVDRLARGGYVEKVDELAPSAKGRKPAGVYRLKRKPLFAPRLDRDGRELPEPAQQVLWRTMKILKVFTPRELVDAASEGRAEPIDLASARFYIGALAGAGVVAIRRPVRSRKEACYALVKMLGARAPQILHTKVVFDPNAPAVVGTAEAREAAR